MSTTDAPLKAHADSGSTLEKRDGIFVLHLFGSPYERGFAHGTLLRDEIRGSHIAEYYSDLLRKLYASSAFAHAAPGFVREKIGELLEWWFYAPLEKLCLEETLEELYGVADASGMDRKTTVRATLAPDIMEHLASSFLEGGKEALGNYYLGGCSGFYVRNTAVKQNAGAIFARNMDFPGAFVWKHPTVIFSHPTESVDVLTRAKGRGTAGEPAADAASPSPAGGFEPVRRTKSPYVYATSAGFPGHGLTGMTADGVAMGTFVCLSRSYGRKGMLMLDFNHYLMTRSDSVASAVALAEREELVSAAPHATVYADSSEAASIEVDSDRSIARLLSSTDDVLAQTNHFLHPQLKEREIEFPLEREHTIGRYRFLKDAIQANYGKIDLSRAVDIITGCFDRLSGEPRVIGDFPSQPITMTSVVFEPGEGRFWMAAGRPPAVCNSEYVGFDMGAELLGQRPRLPSHHRGTQPLIPGFAPTKVSDEMKKSIRHLMVSQEHLNRGKLERAFSELEEAIALHDEPGYRYLHALIRMLAGEYEAAVEEIRVLRRNSQFPPVKSSALILWEARNLDLAERREEAKLVYNELLHVPGIVPNIEKAAKKGLRSAYKPGDRPGTIDYSFLGPTTL